MQTSHTLGLFIRTKPYLHKIFRSLITGSAVIGYGTGIYLIYDSYKILGDVKQDLRIFSPMSNSLISSSCYSFTRNPMYLGGILTVISGWIPTFYLFPIRSNKIMHAVIGCLLFTSLYYLNYYIIPYEEYECQQKYGIEYMQYQQKVPRWIPNKIFMN